MGVSQIIKSPKPTKKSKRHKKKLELLTDDMMQEFDTLISSQSQITNDIQNGLHSAFKLLEDDFKDYIQQNVELDAVELADELQQFEDAIYEMEDQLDIVQEEREELEKINEELNRVVFEMQEADRKKQKIIHKYQEQNKKRIVYKNKSFASDHMKLQPHISTGSVSSNPEIQKLNVAITHQPASYRQYSHASNPN